MAAAQPKKMLIMHILDILKKYTDEDHRLSQKEIGEILKNEYDMVGGPEVHQAEPDGPDRPGVRDRVQ